MPSISVLVIDDEPSILKAITAVLTKESFDVTCADSSSTALGLLESKHFDIMLLDIIMPDQDGFVFLKTVRDLHIFTPVILLSGRLEDSAQVKGLGLGADDYMTKPFNKSLLISKIHALIRRSNQYTTPSNSIPTSITRGRFTLHMDSQAVTKGGQEISLTSREFALLCLFIERPNHIFTKEELFSKVWKSPDTDNNTILVYVKRLRNKLEEHPSKPEHIRTVWGVGYQFYL